MQSISAFIINLLTCDFNRYVGIIPRLWTLNLNGNKHTDGRSDHFSCGPKDPA